MRIKALYGFGDLDASIDLGEDRLRADFRIESLQRHVNNGQLFVEVDFPGGFVEIYPLTRKIKNALKAFAGREPQIVKIQCFN